MDTLSNIIMNILPHQVIRSLRGHAQGDRDPIGDNESKNDAPAQDIFGEGSSNEKTTVTQDAPPQQKQDDFGDAPERSFAPEPVDIYVVRAMLAKAKKLPADIVDLVFDHAEYWVHSSNEIDYKAEHQEPLRVSGRSPSENKFALRSYPVGLTCPHHKKDLSEELNWDTVEAKPVPLEKEQDPEYFKKLAGYATPKLVNPVRKIVFSIRSRDQGHGGEPGSRGTYTGSWTWFEAGLEKFEADQECDAQCTYDVRYKSQASKASPLPVCGLRPVFPEIEPDEEHEGRFKYEHPLFPSEKREIYRNRTATRDWDDREVTWRWSDNLDPTSPEAIALDENEGRGRDSMSGEFVRSLKMGDVVTVWAKARFPAWVNQVEKVKIDIYWAL
ncbi:hypothetical protein B0T10DRAFT_550559 [Thelonectria olida]|uniref:Uncharacterized protein n=1 Tax=Thelonectria olida TaxID=1576542 RepID=A0A9P9AJ92_9HYPO|nr:hypothetical protein B0T10DRAFT_550559 [Thelonectria olida]